jgi:hypothetical protein
MYKYAIGALLRMYKYVIEDYSWQNLVHDLQGPMMTKTIALAGSASFSVTNYSKVSK